ncbi:ferredoxin [Pseudonocardia sp. CA-142604]|uniref:ferredoxin n=1 Tax=Pseudonocardia sp. CA-142604 TaxID=3240024 RepID=UPI003D8A170B
MRAHINLDRCQGYANCVLEADVFDIDDGTGQAYVRLADIPAELADDVRRSASSCPAHAIRVED